jgi:hypothetical protein
MHMQCGPFSTGARQVEAVSSTRHHLMTAGHAFLAICGNYAHTSVRTPSVRIGLGSKHKKESVQPTCACELWNQTGVQEGREGCAQQEFQGGMCLHPWLVRARDQRERARLGCSTAVAAVLRLLKTWSSGAGWYQRYLSGRQCCCDHGLVHVRSYSAADGSPPVVAAGSEEPGRMACG